MLEEMPGLTNPRRLGPKNRLLAALTTEDFARIRAHLERVALFDGSTLVQADKPIERVYFVERGVVSLVAAFRNGGTAEMATVGREGMVGGVGILLGTNAALGDYLVEAAGSALTMEASQFQAALSTTPALLAVCQAYARAFIGQAVQLAACNSVHTVDKRCARRLLMSHDRHDGDTFALKQEQLAKMLGVCRSTATVAACDLQSAGLIRYSRGVLTVLDRPGLEVAACECYRTMRDQFERLLPHTYERPVRLAYGRPRERAYEHGHERRLSAAVR